MKPMLLRALAAATMTTVLGGCVSMAPHYRRPEAPVPMQFGNAATGEADPALAMPAWREVFLEPRLQQVIALALQNNRDLRVAVLQVEKERAQYRIQRAALLPSVDASGSVTRSRVSDANSETGVTQLTESDAVQVGISSWELDLFGRIRSLKNEALQNWLASAENQRAVRTSLVAEVATAWLALAADEQSLAFTQQTLDSQQQTLQRTEARHAQGLASPDLSQVQTSVEAARGRWRSCRPSRRRIAMHCSCWWGHRWIRPCCQPRRRWMAASHWRRCPPTCRPACCCSARTCCPPSMHCRQPTPISVPRAPHSSRRWR